MASIIDIARLANVSKSTVSRVITNSGYVRSETRARIEAVMEELNFRPNLFAMGMRTKRSYSIGILFPDLSNPFLSEWYAVVDRISRGSGFLNYICITDPKGETEEQRIDDLLARNIDGILLFSYRKNQEVLKKLKFISKNTPLVCCNSMFGGEGLNCVFANGRDGTRQAVHHLVQTGKKRIAYIKGKTEYRILENRYNGYLDGLNDLNIPSDDSLVYNGDLSLESGARAAETLMNRPDPPDAIVAGTDYMALGVLDYLRKSNIRVPEDVAVFGFANLQISQNAEPPLSTVATPISAMAEAAINRVISLINNIHQEPEEKVFHCELVLRQSSLKTKNTSKIKPLKAIK
jgi:DNA-binding LacI/PurR family transcriptional regulator